MSRTSKEDAISLLIAETLWNGEQMYQALKDESPKTDEEKDDLLELFVFMAYPREKVAT
jgi:hypothetical protein